MQFIEIDDDGEWFIIGSKIRVADILMDIADGKNIFQVAEDFDDTEDFIGGVIMELARLIGKRSLCAVG